MSLICQLTSEDIKQHHLPTYLRFIDLGSLALKLSANAPVDVPAVQPYSLEGDAVAPVRGEVGDGHAVQRPLEPLQHELLGWHLALVGADLVAQDKVPQQSQNQLAAAAHDVFGAWNPMAEFLKLLLRRPQEP